MNVHAESSPQTPSPAPPTPRMPPRDGGAFSPRYKSPILAAVLSVAPGLGQIYIGYYRQGFVNIVIVLSLILLGVGEVLGDGTPAIGFFVAFFWLYNMIDAGRRAAYYNQAIQGEDDVALPGALPTAGGSGSILFGLALLVAGGILLSNTAFGFSLRWVESWWPLAPIGVGLYLAGRSFVERAGGDHA
jgi:hypothetical protein